MAEYNFNKLVQKKDAVLKSMGLQSQKATAALAKDKAMKSMDPYLKPVNRLQNQKKTGEWTPNPNMKAVSKTQLERAATSYGVEGTKIAHTGRGSHNTLTTTRNLQQVGQMLSNGKDARGKTTRTPYALSTDLEFNKVRHNVLGSKNNNNTTRLTDRTGGEVRAVNREMAFRFIHQKARTDVLGGKRGKTTSLSYFNENNTKATKKGSAIYGVVTKGPSTVLFNDKQKQYLESFKQVVAHKKATTGEGFGDLHTMERDDVIRNYANDKKNKIPSNIVKNINSAYIDMEKHFIEHAQKYNLKELPNYMPAAGTNKFRQEVINQNANPNLVNQNWSIDKADQLNLDALKKKYHSIAPDNTPLHFFDSIPKETIKHKKKK